MVAPAIARQHSQAPPARDPSNALDDPESLVSCAFCATLAVAPRLSAPVGAVRWLQLNVEFLEPGAWRLFLAVLFRAAQRWQKQELLARLFFVRKAPGVRLRFEAHSSEGLEARLTDLLERVSQRVALKWYLTCYEPELHQFGGIAALDAAHTYFAGDTANWWRWAKVTRGQGPLTLERLTLAVLNDLFLRVLDGPEEVWDVWQSIARLHQFDALGAGHEALTLAALFGSVNSREQRLLEAYSTLNQGFADTLQGLLESGQLRQRRRQLLPFIALFHWNRFGLEASTRAALCGSMLTALDPKRAL